jgi:cysteine synthase A
MGIKMVTENILNLIGNTPLISLKSTTGLNIFAKAEFLNPGGSIKDRVALNMIEKAEARGILKPGMTIVEPTSGNTGIGLSLVGVRKGYHVIIVMPENMSEERKKIILALGADLVLTKANLSLGGAVAKAEEIVASSSKYFMPQQFKNPDNPDIHYEKTAQELYHQLEGNIDIFVSGLGSGGTLQGVAKFLKEKNPNIKIVAVEPKNVSALLGHEPGLHSIQGIGDGFIPEILDTSLIDDIVEVSDEAAIETTRELAKVQGLLCGTSSGANVWACKYIARKYGSNNFIATVLADRMERYFSTGLL